MKLGMPVYEGVDLLDVAGPYEMFHWVPPSKGLETVILSADGRPVTSVNGPALRGTSALRTSSGARCFVGTGRRS